MPTHFYLTLGPIYRKPISTKGFKNGGYKGIIKKEYIQTEKYIRNFLNQYFRDITLRRFIKIENNKYEITFDIDWYAEWGSVGIILNTYKGINALGVDLDIFVRNADFF